MTAIAGTDLAKGSTARIDGRWYTLATDPEPLILADGKPFPRALTARHGTPDGEWVVWSADRHYAADPKHPADVIEVTEYLGGGQDQHRVFEVTYRRREYGGWSVHLAGTGRALGWVVPGRDGGWDARIESSAFRGTGPDDTGDPLDDVPAGLYGGGADGSPFKCRAIGHGRDRAEAVTEMVRRLLDKRAPALGYGPHYRVRTWADRHGTAR